MKRTPMIAVVATTLALASAVTWRLQQPPAQQAQPATQDARTPLYWYDPMKPEVHFDAPGKSPFMDMELVPRYADEGAVAQDTADVIRVAPQVARGFEALQRWIEVSGRAVQLRAELRDGGLAVVVPLVEILHEPRHPRLRPAAQHHPPPPRQRPLQQLRQARLERRLARRARR